MSKFDYAYHAVGNILAWRQQADTSAVLWRYGCDAADQLTSAVKHATDTAQTVLQRYAYAYDPAGNRTVEQGEDAPVLAAHDPLNRLLTHTPGGPVVFAGTVNEPATVAIQGRPAAVDATGAFRGTAPVSGGTNVVAITARDASGNVTTQEWAFDVSGRGRHLPTTRMGISPPTAPAPSSGTHATNS